MNKLLQGIAVGLLGTAVGAGLVWAGIVLGAGARSLFP